MSILMKLYFYYDLLINHFPLFTDIYRLNLIRNIWQTAIFATNNIKQH